MKTTHEKAIAAYKAIASIGQQPITAGTAIQLFRLRKALQDAVDFVTEQEKKLVGEAGGQITEEGMIIVADPDKRKKFNERLLDVYRTEYEAPDAITLRASDLPKLTILDLDALDGFVNFE